MPAELNWYQADGVTPLGSLPWGVIPPGESYFGLNGSYLQAVVKNDGDTSASVTIGIQQAGATNTYQHARISVGATPGAFSDHESPINVGSLAPDASVTVWADLIVPELSPLHDQASVTLVAIAT